MDTRNNNRPFSSQTSSQRLYEDDHDEISRICRESGRKPAEEIRDLVSEALTARRNPPAGVNEIMQTLQQLVEQNRLASERYERLLERYERLEERSAGMMLRLNINSTGDDGEIRSRFKNAYERIAGSDDYAKNQGSLRLIQVCVITISACATGFVNAFAHRERLGWVGASLLAILITGFVEKFYFALRHGLTTIYKSRRQRFVASLCYRVIQITMILNAGILCAWVTGSALPESLRLYNQWSIAIHFSLALIGVSAVRDADAVVEDRIRKLKAEAVQEDILTTRRAAINDNPLVLAAARLRGFLDGMSLAVNLLRDKPDLSACDVKQIIDGPQRLFLHSGDPGNTQPSNVTDISGKRLRR